MTPTDQPSKQEAFLTFLQDGWVTIYVDARRPGVAVPEHLRGESRLVLQYGLNMPVPVEDLDVTEGGVKATLSFSRQPYSTLIPWTSIYVIACTDGRGVLYKEDVPAELLTEVQGETSPSEDEDSGPAKPPQAPAVTRGPRGGAALAHARSSDDEAPQEPPQPKPAPRRRLKSVPMPEDKENVADGTSAAGPDTPTPPTEQKPTGRPWLHLVK